MSPDSSTRSKTPSQSYANADLDIRIELGLFSFQERKFEDAMTQADLVLDDSPYDPRGMALRAACFIMTGKVEDGFEVLGRLYEQIKIVEYCEVLDETAEYINIREDGFAVVEWNDLNRCIKFLCQPEFVADEDNDQWNMMLPRLQAFKPALEFDYETAIKNLLQHLLVFPNDTEGRYLLGDCYCDAGKLDFAKELFSQVLDREPEHTFAIAQLARIAALRGDLVTAIELGERACEAAPDDHPSAFNLGVYYLEDHQYEKAIESFESICHCPCVEFECLGNLVDCYRELGEYEKALDITERTLSYDPEMVNRNIPYDLAMEFARINKLVCLSKLNRTEDAEIAFENLAADLPESIQDQAEIGNHLVDQGEFFYAVRLFREIDKRNPDNHDLLIDLAMAENLVGNTVREVEILKTIIAADPNHAVANLNLGATYCNTDQLDKAIEFGKRALELGETNGANWNLATTYAKLSEKEKCLEHLAAAIAGNSSYKGLAVTDPDLLVFADDPEFKRLVSHS